MNSLRDRRPPLRTRSMPSASRARAARAERGDVPGWVLITLMTAGLVTALWVVAKDQLIARCSRARCPR